MNLFARAAVFHTPNAPLRLQDLPLPDPAPDEAIVRIRCATICGSDLHTILGRRPGPAPSVLGHEMTGEIAALPAGGLRDFHGQPLSPGHRVTWSMLWSCGDCHYCRQSLRSKCERLRKFGHEQGLHLFGGYAEYCHLPAGTAIFRVPANLPDSVAAPSNCATATVAAVFRIAGSVAGHCVVVSGAGMLGLTACAMAASQGASSVIALEPCPTRRTLAARFGATAAVRPSEARAAVLDATAGRGAGFALEFAGVPESCESLPPLIRPAGHLVRAGSVFPSRPLALPPEHFVRSLLRMTGVYNYQPADLDTALAFLSAQSAAFPFHELAPAAFPLEQINEAIALAATGIHPRVAIVPRSNT
jgi:putative phosphonate catabolism associated alcohol dehydrogenase